VNAPSAERQSAFAGDRVAPVSSPARNCAFQHPVIVAPQPDTKNDGH